jgi:hypothetical protein
VPPQFSRARCALARPASAARVASVYPRETESPISQHAWERGVVRHIVPSVGFSRYFVGLMSRQIETTEIFLQHFLPGLMGRRQRGDPGEVFWRRRPPRARPFFRGLRLGRGFGGIRRLLSGERGKAAKSRAR